MKNTITLKKSLTASFMFWITKFCLILIPYKHIVLLSTAVIFSAFIFPIVCSLFENKLFICFKKNYIYYFKIGLIISTISIAKGAIFLAPTAVLCKFKAIKFKFIASLAGGAGITLWFFSLTKWAFIPTMKKAKIFENIAASYKLSKNNHIKIFIIYFKTYLLLFLIVTTPIALRYYITSIKKLKSKILKNK